MKNYHILVLLGGKSVDDIRESMQEQEFLKSQLAELEVAMGGESVEDTQMGECQMNHLAHIQIGHDESSITVYPSINPDGTIVWNAIGDAFHVVELETKELAIRAARLKITEQIQNLISVKNLLENELSKS